MCALTLEAQAAPGDKNDVVLPNICGEKQLNGTDLQKPEPLQIIRDSIQRIQFSKDVASGEERHQVREAACIYSGMK